VWAALALSRANRTADTFDVAHQPPPFKRPLRKGYVMHYGISEKNWPDGKRSRPVLKSSAARLSGRRLGEETDAYPVVQSQCAYRQQKRLRPGAVRINLDGEPCGVVTADQASPFIAKVAP
jgi:hypothetical protein